MPLTFPSFGSLRYVFQRIFSELGRTDILMPNKPSKNTLQIGARYSPEFVCTPFKMTLGTFIEGLERGATELGMSAGCGYCRFRFYWQAQKFILEDLGYDFKFIKFDYESPLDIIRQAKKVSVGLNYLQTIRAFQYGWVTNRLTDLVDRLLCKYRAIEIETGDSERIAKQAFQKIVATDRMFKLRMLGKTITKMFSENVEVDKTLEPLKIIVNGEIYVVLEPSLNLDIFKSLNNLGVIAKTPISLRQFIDLPHKVNPFAKMDHEKAICAGKTYVPHTVGGETQQNLGDAVNYKKQGWDGIIHLYPFTCMPEIITRSIFPQVSREHDMPVLSLVLDEHTGEAGFQTRLEAFTDLLLMRRELKNKRRQ